MKKNMYKLLALLAFGVVVFGDTAFAADSATTDSGRSFFSQFILSGGPIVWFVLMPMSMLTVYLIADMFITIRPGKLIPAGRADEIIQLSGSFPAVQLPVRLSENNDLLSGAVARTIEKMRNLGTGANIHETGAEALFEQAQPLVRRIEWCNVIGNVAPMVGLFGTVYGMIKAFNVLGLSAGQPPADKLASAIAIALITTFWGLAIAIPALVICGVFRSRVESIVTHAAVQLEKVLAQIDLDAKKRVIKKTAPKAKGRVEVITPQGVEVK